MAYDLQDLYALPPRDLYLPDLVEHRSRLEAQLMAVAEQLPPEQGMMIEACIELRDELEFQSVKRAIQFSKGGTKGKEVLP